MRCGGPTGRRPPPASGESSSARRPSRLCRSGSGATRIKSRYRAAYFERIPGIWCQGDFAEVTSHGGFVIYGRSDATLNPGGVRIGTAEIYAEVEKIPKVADCVAVGQDWEGDVRVVLFVALREGAVLDEALIAAIKAGIRQGSSPRHVPARILAVPDIPRTRTGKVSELAVRDAVHGRPVRISRRSPTPRRCSTFATYLNCGPEN